MNNIFKLYFTENLKINIILIEPNGPLNVGSIARLCSNFKVNQLRIVSPKCDIFSIESKKMALKGFTYLQKNNIYKNLNEAIIDCDLVIATCGRVSISKNSKIDFIERINPFINEYKNVRNLAIIFGREDRGLTNKELLMAHKIFTINASDNYPSLNLSHAVSITLYELLKKSPKINQIITKKPALASSVQIDESCNDIERLLLKIGYLLPHTSNAKMNKFKQYIIKSDTSKNELNIIRGIINQINWALKNFEKLKV